MFTRRTLIASAGAGIFMPAVLRYRAAWAAGSRVRRNASAMAADNPFFKDYAAAVAAMHKLPANDRRNWRNLALVHIENCPHGARDFLHWHRWYIYHFEQICGALIGKPDFALAYWNWEGQTSNIPAPFFDVPELNVTHWKDRSDAQSENWGPQRITTIGARGVAKGQTMFSMKRFSAAFRPSMINAIRRSTRFDIFTSMLEQTPHNSTHTAVGTVRPRAGHMLLAMSPLDPIFWLHHCNVDRLWAEWDESGNLSDDPRRSYAGQFSDERGRLNEEANSSDSLSILPFGYSYDTIEAATAGARAGTEPAADTGFGGMIANLQPTEPMAAGAAAGATNIRINAGAELAVTVPDLASVLSDQRVFRAQGTRGMTRNALEPRRIIVKIEQVLPPQAGAVTVGAFINSPNLTPGTPTDDRHCATIFSFFGPGPSSGVHAGVHGDNLPLYMDVTDTVRSLAAEGGIEGSGFKLQLMPVSLEEEKPAPNAAVTIGPVSILSA
jgi:tyrosinase